MQVALLSQGVTYLIRMVATIVAVCAVVTVL